MIVMVMSHLNTIIHGMNSVRSHGVIEKHIRISKKRFVLDCIFFNGDVKKNIVIVVIYRNSTGQYDDNVAVVLVLLSHNNFSGV